MPPPVEIPGSAALAIIEALLLALNDRNVMPESAIVDILKAAAETLQNRSRTAGTPSEAEVFRQAAALIATIVAGRNSVRRP